MRSLIGKRARTGNRAQLLAVLLELDPILAGRGPLEPGLNQLCERVAQVLDAPCVWIGLRAPDGTVPVTASGGRLGERAESLSLRWKGNPVSDGPTAKALRTGRTQRERLEKDPADAEGAAVVGWGVQAVLAVPILYQGEVQAAISAYAGADQEWEAGAEDLMQHLAVRLGPLIAEVRNRQQLQVLTTAVNMVSEAIAVVDRAGRISAVNPAFTRLTGYTAREVIGKSPRVLQSGLMPESAYAVLWSAITAAQTWSGELLNRRKDGSIYVDHQTIAPVVGPDGEVTHYVSIRSDGSQRRPAAEREGSAAPRDASGRQARGPGAVLRLAVERIEPEAAASAGDAAVETAIRQVVGTQDLIARYDHGRFAILLHAVDEEDAVRTGEKLRDAVHAHLTGVPGLTLSVSVSLTMLVGGKPSGQVFTLPDVAPARTRPAATVTVAESGSHEQDRDLWESRILAAAAGDGLVLHYQPVVRLADGAVQYWEALLRMKDGQEGLLLPGEFIPRAFRCGLMPTLDLWVVESALQALADHPDLFVAVNLSSQTIAHEDTMARIEQAVRNRRPGPGQLVFEITETSSQQEAAHAWTWGKRMRALGCRVALDHFGLHGTPSLEQLRTLPIDVVKINAGYVQQLLDDAGRGSFVRALIAGCRSAHIQLVANCIESEAAAERLRSAGITLGQGFLWGRPAPMEVVARKLSGSDAGEGFPSG